MKPCAPTWKASSLRTTPAISDSPSTTLQVLVWVLSQKRCEPTYRTCPNLLYLHPLRLIQTLIQFQAIRRTQALLTRDLDLDREHHVRSLTEEDLFLGLLIEEAGDVHTVRRDQGHSQDLYLHEEGDAASLALPALPDEDVVTIVRAAHDPLPHETARVGLAAPHTHLEVVPARLHVKHVDARIPSLRKDDRRYLQLEMGEAAHMIPRADLLLL